MAGVGGEVIGDLGRQFRLGLRQCVIDNGQDLGLFPAGLPQEIMQKQISRSENVVCKQHAVLPAHLDGFLDQVHLSVAQQ